MANRTAPRIRLTKTAIDELPTPASDRDIYYDSRRLGLGLRVLSSGRRVWFWIGRLHGRTVRETLGTYPELAPDVAWAKARKVAARVGEGQRPTEARRAEREELARTITLGKAYADYCDHHKVRSVKTRDSEWKCYLKRWEHRDLAAITKTDVRTWFRKLTDDTSRSTANRALTRLRALYSWARREMDYEGPDPSTAVTKHSEKSARRKRRLRVDELAGFFKALAGITPDMRDFFRVTLYTGQRAGSVKAMRWADLDLSGNVWTIATTKQDEAADVALAPQVVEILTERRAYLLERVRRRKERWAKKRKGPEPTHSPFVFPGRGRSGHMETYAKAWDELTAAGGIEGLRVHDLRRSLASFAQEVGIGTALVAAQLGHADAATTLRHYSSMAPKSQRDAIEKVLTHMIEGQGDRPAESL